LNIDYFTNNYQNGALSIYATIALFFLVSMFATLSNRPQILYFIQKNHCFFITAVFVISANKSNDLLLLLLRLSNDGYKSYRNPSRKIKTDGTFVLIACSLFAFFSQL
jgi:hypothetical protein